MNFPHEMDSLAIFWGIVFVAFSLWFLKRNRNASTRTKRNSRIGALRTRNSKTTTVSRRG